MAILYFKYSIWDYYTMYKWWKWSHSNNNALKSPSGVKLCNGVKKVNLKELDVHQETR